jgi:hypothetical protein
MDGDFNGRYILDEAGHVMPCPDLMEWARWMETCQHRVALDQVGDYRISTIFLGLDHSFNPDPMSDPLTYMPVLWETMVFDVISGPVFQRHYTSREAALAGHAEVIPWVERNQKLQESQLADMLNEISKSVVADRGASTDHSEE